MPVFEKRKGEGFLDYVFPRLVIRIDATGMNQKDLPELTFAQYDAEPEKASYFQPDTGGISMDYVRDCMREVVRDSGEKRFWVMPYSRDVPDAADRSALDARRAARLRLFRRWGNIIESPTGYGYILEADDT